MKKWALKVVSDSEYACDKETRISVLDTFLTFVEFQLLGEAKE